MNNYDVARSDPVHPTPCFWRRLHGVAGVCVVVVLLASCRPPGRQEDAAQPTPPPTRAVLAGTYRPSDNEAIRLRLSEQSYAPSLVLRADGTFALSDFPLGLIQFPTGKPTSLLSTSGTWVVRSVTRTGTSTTFPGSPVPFTVHLLVLSNLESRVYGAIKPAGSGYLITLATFDPPDGPAPVPMPVDERPVRLEFERAASGPVVSRGSREIPPRPSGIPKQFVDLTDFYGTTLEKPFADDVGGEDLAELTPGLHTLAGVTFDIRGVLGGTKRNIPIRSRVERAYFLCGARYAGGIQSPQAIGAFRMYYEDRSSVEMPVHLQRHVRDWIAFGHEPMESEESELAWVGSNPYSRDAGLRIRLYKVTWVNPTPEMEVQELSISVSYPQLFVLGITFDPGDLQPIVPEDPLVQVEVSTALGRGAAANLALLDEVLSQRAPTREILWLRARNLARVGRTKEAVESLSLALADETMGWPWPDSKRRTVLGERSALLQVLGRAVEARTDWLNSKGIPERTAGAPSKLIDLSPYFTAALGEPFLGGPYWNSLSTLPVGTQKFGRVLFDTRGVVQLRGAGNVTHFPATVTNIVVGQAVRRVHVLHGTGWTEATGTRIATLRLHYGNQQITVLPIVYGDHVRDWTVESDPARWGRDGKVVWRGKNRAGTKVRLYLSSWNSPLEGHILQSIDYTSELTQCAPFLVAITVE